MVNCVVIARREEERSPGTGEERSHAQEESQITDPAVRSFHERFKELIAVIEQTRVRDRRQDCFHTLTQNSLR